MLLLSRVGRSFEECSVASVIFEQILRKPYYVRPIGPCRVVYKVWQSWATGFVQGHQENPNNNFSAALLSGTQLGDRIPRLP